MLKHLCFVCGSGGCLFIAIYLWGWMMKVVLFLEGTNKAVLNGYIPISRARLREAKRILDVYKRGVRDETTKIFWEIGVALNDPCYWRNVLPELAEAYPEQVFVCAIWKRSFYLVKKLYKIVD